MFSTIFSKKSAKAWTSLFVTAGAWYVASQTGMPPEVVAPVLGGIFTWMVPNG